VPQVFARVGFAVTWGNIVGKEYNCAEVLGRSHEGNPNEPYLFLFVSLT
jgi:hypothetical protein